jgi:hypothetical protein
MYGKDGGSYTRRDRAASFGVAIHLGHNDGSKISTLLEGATLRLSRLTYRCSADVESSVKGI